MERMKFGFVGECMVELQETGTGMLTQTFGGDTLNSAIYCARLARAFPVEVEYVTALGTDPFSEKMISFWEKEGVRSSLVQCVEGERPGLYYIELDHQGERKFHYWRGEAAAKKCFEFSGSSEVLDRLSEFSAIYLSGISLAIFTETSRKNLIERLKTVQSMGVRIYFDCNYRPHLWGSAQRAIDAYAELYPLSDIVFLTTEEGEELLGTSDTEAMHDSLQTRGCPESVVKDGGDACSIMVAGGVLKVPAMAVDQVVDTTAAGDSFSAAYLLARNLGCAPEQAALLAHKTAAYVIGHKGAIAPEPGMPVTSSDVEAARSASMQQR